MRRDTRRWAAGHPQGNTLCLYVHLRYFIHFPLAHAPCWSYLCRAIFGWLASLVFSKARPSCPAKSESHAHMSRQNSSLLAWSFVCIVSLIGLQSTASDDCLPRRVVDAVIAHDQFLCLCSLLPACRS